MTVQSVTNCVANVVKAFVTQTQTVDAQAAQLLGARFTMLEKLAMALKDAPKVNEASWDKDWKEPMTKALKASDRFSTDGAARNALSMLKVAVIALTNGIKPGVEDINLKAFVDKTARPQAQAAKLLKASGSGGAKSAERKSPTKESQRTQAFLIVARRDKTLALELQTVIDNADMLEELREFLSDTIVAQDDKVTTKRRGAK